MTRTSGSSLAPTAFRSLVQRVSQRPLLRRTGCRRPVRSRLRRRYDCHNSICVAAEVLEVRQLLFAPSAMSDSYAITHDHALTVSSGSSVLNNDTNMGMGTM